MSLLDELTGRLKQLIWGRDASRLPFWRAVPIRIARVVWLLVMELTEGQLSMRAMSLVYTTLLSLVPLLAVSFSVLKAFEVHNQIEPMLLNFLAPLGEKGVEISATVIGFVDNMRVGVLGSVGLGMLFYTAVSLIQKVERSFNYTWHVSQHRPFVERFSDYLSVLLIGPVLVFSALGATASVMNTELVRSLTELPFLGWIVAAAGRLLPYFFVIAAFTFVYLFVPNTRVRVGSAVVGALVAGVLWQTIGWGFALFVVNSAKYSAIYSGFAILILFMIWLYLAWLILLVGASIAFYHQHPEYLGRQRAGEDRPGGQQIERLGLHALCLVARRHFDGAPAATAEQLASSLNTSPAVLEEVLQLLLRDGMLISVPGNPETYLPGRAPERTSVSSVLDVLRRAEQRHEFPAPAAEFSESLTGLFDRLDQDRLRSLGGLSVRDLVLEPAPPPASTLAGDGLVGEADADAEPANPYPNRRNC